MRNRVLIGLIVGVAIVLVLVFGLIAGGGIIYAATQWIGPRLTADRLPGQSVLAQADPQSGLLVAQVDPDGAAAQAGIVRGDILLTVDGQPVKNRRDFVQVLEAIESVEHVKVTVLHGDEVRENTVLLEERDGRTVLGIQTCSPSFSGLSPLAERFAGAMIVEVLPDSPAEVARLEPGDLIVSVGDQPVDADHDLAQVINSFAPGEQVTLTIKAQDGSSRSLKVRLGQHPDDETRPYLGVRYRELQIEKRFDEQDMPPGKLPFEGLPELPFDRRFPFDPPHEGLQQGVFIVEVIPDSPAEEVGLVKGEQITEVDGQKVESPQMLIREIQEREPGEEVTFTLLQKDGSERQVVVRLGENPAQAGEAYLGVRLGSFFQFRESIPRDESGIRQLAELKKLLPDIKPFFNFDQDI